MVTKKMEKTLIKELKIEEVNIKKSSTFEAMARNWCRATCA
jgi:hypothetical protein